MVKMYACNNATKISISEIANDNKNDILLPTQLWKININATKLINTICPAKMLAYKRIIKENGLMIVPNNSIGAKISFIRTGTPGIQKICIQ